MNIMINRKAFIFFGIFALLLSSLTVTFMFENDLSDGLSITVSVLSSFALFLTSVVTIFDIILDICNP
jgi:hypothetical protein